MKTMLMLFGYTEYQASCIAPIMWFFVLGTVVYGIANYTNLLDGLFKMEDKNNEHKH